MSTKESLMLTFQLNTHLYLLCCMYFIIIYFALVVLFVPISTALLPGVPVAGGFHSSSYCGLSDNRTLLQCGSALRRDEHQCGLVPAGTLLCHVSLYQSLFICLLFLFLTTLSDLISTVLLSKCLNWIGNIWSFS